MQQKQFILQNKGMNRDLSISKIGESAAYENRNIRILATCNDTTLSVTNERGNKKITNLSFIGTLVGYGVLNNYIILFTVFGSNSFIYRVTQTGDSFSSILIFRGKLGFSADHPIETIMDYETEDIQKVYWLDGVNVLRFLNFSDSYLTKHLKSGTLSANPVFTFADDITWFDSNRPSSIIPTVSIDKDNSGNSRPNGVAQYFLTYYNKNGQQTGIIYASPLVYLSPNEHGGSAEGTNSNRITVTATKLDETYDYVRLYQILRTSINGQSVAYIVGESEVINGAVTFVDDGAHYTSIDVTSLLYLGSQNLIAGTMTQKDGTLFLGDLKSVGNASIDSLEKVIKNTAFNLKKDTFTTGVDWESCIVKFQRTTTKDLTSQMNHLPYVYAEGYYPYKNQLQYTNAQITTFKGGEKYRFALRFIRSNGTMSKSFWIGDKVNPYYPQMRSDNVVARVIAVCELPDNITTKAKDLGFTSVQLMIAEATYSDRSVQAQGILSPTVFNLYNRFSGQNFSQASWIFRPKNGDYSNIHMSPLLNSNEAHSELQCSSWQEDTIAPTPFYYTNDSNELLNKPDGFNYGVALAIKVTVHATKFITNYTGKIEIKYFANLGDSDDKAIRTYNKRIGSNSSLYHNSLLRITRDWLQAYEDANVPAGNRLTADEIKSICRKARSRAIYTYVYNKAGTAVYQLNESETDNHQVKLEFTQLDYSHMFAKTNRQHFFVDESILTLNSPEIEQQAVSFDRNSGLKLRIAGVAKMTGNITDYTVETENAKSPGEHLIKYEFSNSNLSDASEGLSAWPCYLEYAYTPDGDDKYKRLATTYSYMLYMWHKSGSIPSFGDDDTLWSTLKTKRFANLHFSMYSIFNDYEVNDWSVTPDDLRQVSDAGATMYELKRGSDTDIYTGDVNDLIVMPGNDVKYPIYASKYETLPGNSLSLTEMQTVSDPVSITYKSKAHAAISLPVVSDVETILPYLYINEAFKLDDVEAKDETTGESIHVNGPFSPWMKASYKSKKLLYRNVDSTSATDLNDLTKGAYGTFTVLSKNTDSKVVTMISSLQDETMTEDSLSALDSLKVSIPETVSDTVVYGHTLLSDNTVLLTDLSDLTLVNTAVEAQLGTAGNHAQFIRFSSNVTMSDILLSIYVKSGSKTELLVSLHNGSETNDYSFDMTRRSYPASSILIIKFKVTYAPTYLAADGTKKAIVPELNSDNFDEYIVPVTGLFTKSEEYIHAAYVDRGVYIDPTETPASAIEFVNIATTPNRYFVFNTDKTFSVDGNYSMLFKSPNQVQYKLSDDSLISEGDKYLFIGELYKDYDTDAITNPASDTRYGGITESAVENNTFIEASTRVGLDDLTTVNGYTSAEIDCSSLIEYICNTQDPSASDFKLNINLGGENNTVSLNTLERLSSSDFLPTNKNKVHSLEYHNSGNGYISRIPSLSSTMQNLIANNPDYKIVVLRYGYARRGKWRTFVDKLGNKQTSHTTRTPEYKTKRVGYSKSLPALRYRMIGADLLISSHTMSEQSASCTWQTKCRQDSWIRHVDYTKATLVSSLGDSLTLPPLRTDYAKTTKGHYPNPSRNGITDLYIGLFHKENGTWKLASNVTKVRGRTHDGERVWEFDKVILK